MCRRWVCFGMPQDMHSIHRYTVPLAEPSHECSGATILAFSGGETAISSTKCAWCTSNMLDADTIAVSTMSMIGYIVVLNHLHHLSVLSDDIMGTDSRSRIREPCDGTVNVRVPICDVDHNPINGAIWTSGGARYVPPIVITGSRYKARG